jgi:polyadenylate-binding protein
MINNRMCRVLPFSRDGTSQKRASSEANIFIKNLDPSIDSQALYDTFSAFGRIVSCKVAVDEFGLPKGFAYLSYDNKESAEDAIQRMDGMLLNDRKVYVSKHIPKRERLIKLEDEKVNFTNLFVKNIDSTVDENDLTDLFSKHGDIVSVSLPKATPVGVSKGYGFVNFKTHDDAVKALQALNDFEFRGKKLNVSRAQRKHDRDEDPRGGAYWDGSRSRYQGVNLYVKHLAPTVTDEELQQTFSPYGIITSAKVMMDESGESRGFGFVCYSTPEEAQAAIGAMHESELHGSKLYVALAQRREHYNKRGLQGGFQPPMPLLPLRAGPFVASQFMAPQFYYPIPPNMSSSAPATPMMNPIPNPWAAAAAVVAANNANGGRPSFSSIPSSPFLACPPPPAAPLSRSATPNGKRPPSGASATVPINGRSKAAGRRWPEEFATAGVAREEDGSSLSAAVASAANSDAENQVIGDALYPRVRDHPCINGDTGLAAKITGILLDQNHDDLVRWFDVEPVLNRRIEQAYEAYQEFLQSQSHQQDSVSSAQK